MKRKYRDILFLRYCTHCKNCKSNGSVGSVLSVSKHGTALDSVQCAQNSLPVYSVPEMCCVISYLTAQQKSAKEIHVQLCHVYGEQCMSIQKVCKCGKNSKMGERL